LNHTQTGCSKEQIQRDQLSGKPGNVWEFGLAAVRELSKSQRNVKIKTLSGKTGYN